MSLVSNPGTSLAYSNANYVVLGQLVERVSGTEFGDYVAENVFGPLGMTDAYADFGRARADGLTDAYRFWFGGPGPACRCGGPISFRRAG